MKYAKMLGLLAVAAAALMAFAGTASATLTDGEGNPVTDVHASSKGATVLDGTINISCQKSTVEGEVTSDTADHASGPINNLTFTECGNHTVTVNAPGSLTIENVSGNTGTLRSTGAEVTVLTHSLFLGTRHCIYTTNGTHIGPVRGSGHATNPNTGATLSIDSAPIPQTATDSLCGNDAEWTGTYEISGPAHLVLD